MAESPDDLTVKELLEIYFRVQDLQEVLKSFDLPFSGRKTELFQRVLSLINHREYELDFISKVKKKIVDIYSNRIELQLDHNMAPVVNRESRRYESDDSYSPSGEPSEHEEDVEPEEAIESEESLELNSSDHRIDDKVSKQKTKKRKRVIETHSSSSSASSSDKNSSDESSNDGSDVLDRYCRQSRRQKKLEKKKRIKSKRINSEINKKVKKRMKRRISASSSSDSEDNKGSNESDSDDSTVNRTKRTVKKTPINIVLSSSESESDSDNETNDNKNNKESDDEIEFIEWVPAHKSTIVRTKHIVSDSGTGFKGTSSSNTEGSLESEDSSSDSDMETNKTTETPSLVNSSVANEVSMNVSSSQITADKTPEVEMEGISSDSLEDLSPEIQNNNTTSTTGTDIADPIVEKTAVTSSSPINSGQSLLKLSPLKILLKLKPTPVVPQYEQLPKYELETVIKVKTPHKPLTKSTNTKPTDVVPPLPENLYFTAIPSNATIENIKNRLNGNDGSEVEAIDQILKVSLLCPITNRRISRPSRSKECTHFDCFDIDNFLEINCNKAMKDWKCPKCRVAADYHSLIIDSVESVIFDNKAFWKPVGNKVDTCVDNSKQKDVINLDNSTEGVIELDDDEESNPIVEQLNSVTSRIESAKSVQQNISNIVKSNKEKSKERQISKIMEYLISDQSLFNQPVHQTANNVSQRQTQVQNLFLHPSTTPQNIAQQSRTQTQNITFTSNPSVQQNTVNTNRTQNTVYINQTQNTVNSTQHAINTNRTQNTVNTTQNAINTNRTQNIVNTNPTQNTVNRNQTQNTINTNRTQNTVNTNRSQNTGGLKFEFSDGHISKVFCSVCNQRVPFNSINFKHDMSVHFESERHRNLVNLRSAPNNTQSGGHSGGQSGGQTVSQSGTQIATQVRNNPNANSGQNNIPVIGRQTTSSSGSEQYINSNYISFSNNSGNTAYQNQYPVQTSYMSAQPQHYSNPNYYQNFQNYYPNNNPYPTAQLNAVPAAHQSSAQPPTAHTPNQAYIPPTAYVTVPPQIAHNTNTYPNYNQNQPNYPSYGYM